MPPRLALLVFWVGTLGLFLLDRDRDSRTSAALWLPVVWLAIGGSRNISVWFGNSAITASADQYLEGSPLDRALLSALIAVGIAVLVARSRVTVDVLRRNAPLLIFFFYCLASTLWSDFPFVAFKRWTKVLGNVVMGLIVLTDPNRPAATKKFLTWTAFLLIPQSVMLIKYFPEMGRYYDRWEGTTFYSGVTTDKNLLGVICLVVGFGLLARFMESLRATEHRYRKLLAVGAVLGMDLWLLSVANSATSLGCFLVGSVLIIVLSLSRRSRPALVHLMVGGIALVGFIAYVSPGVFAFFVESAGRNTSLTGRTELWDDLLPMATHPWVGAGFESFFLGDRIDVLWAKYWWHPNEAHNGYLETYLTLGFIGLGLLGLLMATGYRNAVNVYRKDPIVGSMQLTFVVIAAIYNLTEAGFKVTGALWILFLLAVMAVPQVQGAEHGTKELAQAGRADRSKTGQASRAAGRLFGRAPRGDRIDAARATQFPRKNPYK